MSLLQASVKFNDGHIVSKLVAYITVKDKYLKPSSKISALVFENNIILILI